MSKDPEFARLLSLASHEFRTPASVVGGYLRMLQKDNAGMDERQQKMIDEAAKAMARLVGLIGELSEVGKLDSGQAAVRLESFDLFSALEEVAANVHEGRDREVQLQLIGASNGARLIGDRPRLLAAFGAFFHALLREQPTSVTVVADRRLLSSGSGASAVVVIARDTDVQRAYGAVAQPFDEFRGGVGLSLPIGRRVVERAGGHVWSPTPTDDSDRGLRSAMVVSIPLPQ
ncbi:MAG: HAMP domain-containing sensor histidine kinase [Vicinamibacterales bacterium]